MTVFVTGAFEDTGETVPSARTPPTVANAEDGSSGSSRELDHPTVPVGRPAPGSGSEASPARSRATASAGTA
ncbi:MAG: hypothetical protein L3K09_05235 [Thermoplasmata archaeon]|nr:hypothetical protein [Thermoplasmata archaeon]